MRLLHVAEAAAAATVRATPDAGVHARCAVAARVRVRVMHPVVVRRFSRVTLHDEKEIKKKHGNAAISHSGSIFFKSVQFPLETNDRPLDAIIRDHFRQQRSVSIATRIFLPDPQEREQEQADFVGERQAARRFRLRLIGDERSPLKSSCSRSIRLSSWILNREKDLKRSLFSSLRGSWQSRFNARENHARSKQIRFVTNGDASTRGKRREGGVFFLKIRALISH